MSYEINKQCCFICKQSINTKINTSIHNTEMPYIIVYPHSLHSTYNKYIEIITKYLYLTFKNIFKSIAYSLVTIVTFLLLGYIGILMIYLLRGCNVNINHAFTLINI